eukprot:gene19177-2115_t
MLLSGWKGAECRRHEEVDAAGARAAARSAAAAGGAGGGSTVDEGGPRALPTPRPASRHAEGRAGRTNAPQFVVASAAGTSSLSHTGEPPPDSPARDGPPPLLVGLPPALVFSLDAGI